MRQKSFHDDHSLYVEQHAFSLLSHHADLLAILQEVDVELNHTLDLDSVMQVAINAAQVLSHASSGCIILIDGGALMVFAAFGGYEGVTSLPADGIILRALREERSEYLLDVTEDPDYCPMIPGIRAQIAVPMLAHHRIVGLLNVETEHANHFTPEVFEAVALLAGRIASAVENARLYRTSQEQLAELHRLYADLTALEQLKSDMIRITAHDLRSPLSLVYSYTDLLQNEL
ncbi:MAG: GAF domain-containing protein, partial [Anaerolinea sp.]|nr:GAF domain-containing protein [Anaerolinea sp.]